MSKQVLIVIDIQNDYFEEGKFPLWNVEQTLKNAEGAINKANAKHPGYSRTAHCRCK